MWELYVMCFYNSNKTMIYFIDWSSSMHKCKTRSIRPTASCLISSDIKVSGISCLKFAKGRKIKFMPSDILELCSPDVITSDVLTRSSNLHSIRWNRMFPSCIILFDRSPLNIVLDKKCAYCLSENFSREFLNHKNKILQINIFLPNTFTIFDVFNW